MSAVQIGPEPGVEQDVRLVRTPSPAAIVIFGATGDLTQRKLVPALYSLATQQLLALVSPGFAHRLSYVSAPFDQADGYERLRAHLETLDAELGTRGNRLFYLATAPEFFPVIAENLGGAGLAEEPDDGERFARLVVEKPFGIDLASGRGLHARPNPVLRARHV